MIALCGICGGRMAGSSMVDLTDGTIVGSIYLIHVIDEHWDIVERIRATAHDVDARLRLNDELVREFSR